MKSLFGSRESPRVWALVLGVWIACGSARTVGQDKVNRRDQARKAFLAHPQGVFLQYCAHCHGEDGKGDGRLWTSELSPAPADLTALKVDRVYLVKAIREGSAAHGKSNLCPPWGRTIPSEKIQRLAQYLLGMRGARGAETAGVEPPPAAQNVPPASAWPWVAVIAGELGILAWTLVRRRKTGDETAKPRVIHRSR